MTNISTKNIRILMYMNKNVIRILFLIILVLSSICSAKEGIEFAIEKNYVEALKKFEKETNDYPNDQFYKDAIIISKMVIDKKIKKEATKLFFEGMVQFRKLKNYRAASSLIKKAIESGSQTAEIYYYLGVSYLKINLYNKAQESFNSALNHSPGSGRLYYYRGTTYQFLKDSDNAFDDYKKAEELGHGIYPLYLNMGKIYESKGNTSKAIESYADAYKIFVVESCDLEKQITGFNSKIKKARETADWILLKSKWVDGTEEYHDKKAFQLKERNSEINHMLGNSYYNKGERNLAIKFFKQAIRVDRELIDLYLQDEDNYPYRKIQKLEFLFNRSVEKLIAYYKGINDNTLCDVYKNIGKVMNGKIEKTKIK